MNIKYHYGNWMANVFNRNLKYNFSKNNDHESWPILFKTSENTQNTIQDIENNPIKHYYLCILVSENIIGCSLTKIENKNICMTWSFERSDIDIYPSDMFFNIWS